MNYSDLIWEGCLGAYQADTLDTVGSLSEKSKEKVLKPKLYTFNIDTLNYYVNNLSVRV